MKRPRKTPISDAALRDDWPRYCAEVLAKMEQAKLEYGDGSFSREPLELVRELKKESLDYAGWGFILWRRLDQIERELEEAAKQ